MLCCALTSAGVPCTHPTGHGAETKSRCGAQVELLGVREQAEGRRDTPVYVLRDLRPGHSVPGPAIVLDDISTVVVEPGCTAHVTPAGDLRVDVGSASAGPQQAPIECDPIQLAIFSHRCTSHRVTPPSQDILHLIFLMVSFCFVCQRRLVEKC